MARHAWSIAPRLLRAACGLAALAVAGCAADGQAIRPSVLRDAIGGPIAAVVAAYGPPAERAARDGGERYVWQYKGERLVDQGRGPPTVGATNQGPIYAPGQRRLPELQAVSCRLEVDTDPAGTVRDWRARGDACIEVLEEPRRWREPS